MVCCHQAQLNRGCCRLLNACQTTWTTRGSSSSEPSTASLTLHGRARNLVLDEWPSGLSIVFLSGDQDTSAREGGDHEPDIRPFTIAACTWTASCVTTPFLTPDSSRHRGISQSLLMARAVWLHDFDGCESADGSDVSASPLHEGEREGAGLLQGRTKI